MTVRVLVASDFVQEWRAPAWARGLREAGATVEEYDWSVHYSPGRLGYLERRALVGPGIRQINNGLVRAVRAAAPDVVLVYAGWPITPRTIEQLSRTDCIAGYDNDNPFGRWGTKLYYRHYREALSRYTCHHVFREANVADYRAAGCQRVKLLRSFYLPWVHQPVPVGPEERRRFGADVVFVGNGQPGSRIEGITALVDAGVDVRILGDARYWRRYLPRRVLRVLPPIAPVGAIDHAKAVCSAKICLAFFSDGNRDGYSVRSFEIPAMGAFMLAQRTPVMRGLFEEGREAEFFDGTDELVEKVQVYIKDDEARDRVARAGRERCLRDGHDVVSRMLRWLTDLQEWGLIRDDCDGSSGDR